MHKLTFDTNTYVALNKGLLTVKNAYKNSAGIAMPFIVIGELYFGFENGTKREENIRDLSKFLETSDLEVLYADSQTARIYGEIAAELKTIGKPMQENDVWIAALSKQHGCTVLTADTGFKNIKGLDTITFDLDASS